MSAFAFDAVIGPNSPLVVSETIDGEAIIMHHGTGRYFDTSGTGALIWQAIDGLATPAAIAEALSDACGIGADAARTATAAFIAQLAEHGLVKSAMGNPAAALGMTPTPFATPELGVHDDLADMLLLDPVHDVDDSGWPAARQHSNAA